MLFTIIVYANLCARSLREPLRERCIPNRRPRVPGFDREKSPLSLQVRQETRCYLQPNVSATSSNSRPGWIAVFCIKHPDMVASKRPNASPSILEVVESGVRHRFKISDAERPPNIVVGLRWNHAWRRAPSSQDLAHVTHRQDAVCWNVTRWPPFTTATTNPTEMCLDLFVKVPAFLISHLYC